MSQAAPTQPPTTPRSDRTILRAKGVKKTYKVGEETLLVLRGIDLAVREGEFLAIEGRSGSGKSTLMHILAGLDAPDGGQIEYGGHDIGALASVAARRRKFLKWLGALRFLLLNLVDLLLLLTNRADRKLARIRNTDFGFVFQFYHLLPELNVLENTLLGPMIQLSVLSFRSRQDELMSRAQQILTELGLGHRLKHRPNQLSGGERQRVAIARALMNSPRILFADEPTGNLDAETGRQIMSVLEKLHREQGQTILLVTHDRSLARQADRVLVLRDGKLEKPGSPSASESPTTLDSH